MRCTWSTGWLMALAICLVAFAELATVAGADDQAAALDQLKGSWKAIAVEIGGEKLPKDAVEANPAVMAIDGNKLAFKVEDKTVVEGEMKIDASKIPKQIDTIGPPRPGGEPQKMIGIYEATGDTLKICFVPAGGKRPTSFKTKAGVEGTLITYKRV